MKSKILAVIPARGGSKGIPRKNISLLKGKPLIAHVIKNALDSDFITDLYVSTDDKEIAEISSLYGANTINRPKELAKDDTPLDPVIYHCVKEVEEKNNNKYDFVITIQPTCPLLSTKSLDIAIKRMIDGNYDTLISVTNETHLYWTKKNNDYFPLYESRKNRQYLDPIFKETGAIVISKRNVVTPETRFGKNVYLFELPKNESVDIDTYSDWWTAENLLNKKKVLFRVDGDRDIGMGHIYRAITLAKRLVFNHDLVFLMNEEKKLGISKVKEYHFNIVTIKDEENSIDKIKKINPDIVINDILDTSKKYIKELKDNRFFVVNFEDFGDGADFADIVINGIYENSHPSKHYFYGYKYICLRDEFYIFPKKSIKEDVNNILCTFGGTDPNNLTMKTLKAIEMMDRKDISYNIILGLGFSDKESVKNYASRLNDLGFSIDIKKNVSMMAKEMYDADIVITSNGRTIYEVSSVGTPCISIAQNEREAMHLFVHNSKCIKYLGMAVSLPLDKLVSAIEEMIDNYELRKEFNQKLLNFDLQGGIERVIDLIFNYEGDKK